MKTIKHKAFHDGEMRYNASPVWFDIRQSNTLQRTSARDETDERHICPLQLDAIQRCTELWTNPGDLVQHIDLGIRNDAPFWSVRARGFVWDLQPPTQEARPKAGCDLMNENLDRLLHGWHPRKDAHWFWRVLADLIVLLSIVKLEIPKVWQRRPKHLRLTK